MHYYTHVTDRTLARPASIRGRTAYMTQLCTPAHAHVHEGKGYSSPVPCLVTPLLIDQYPLPKPSDLMTFLTGGQRFSKLDLCSAYQQIVLDDEASKLVVINTHQGLYKYTTLPFGVASAPAIFQKTMDGILQGIPHCICYLDNILVTGRSDKEHVENLKRVLQSL